MGDDFGGFARDGSDAETRVLLEDFLSVEVVECLRCVGSCYLLKDVFSARMSVNEFCCIVDFGVDYKPLGKENSIRDVQEFGGCGGEKEGLPGSPPYCSSLLHPW
jgi:hypothetical protein